MEGNVCKACGPKVQLPCLYIAAESILFTISIMTLPAHLTKHIPSLEARFHSSTFSLSQRSDGISNGTALWLGAQVLASYLADALPPPQHSSESTVLELGSGIGFSAWVPAWPSAHSPLDLIL